MSDPGRCECGAYRTARPGAPAELGGAPDEVLQWMHERSSRGGTATELAGRRTSDRVRVSEGWQPLETGEEDGGVRSAELDPSLMDLAEQIMSGTAAAQSRSGTGLILPTEQTTWTRCFEASDVANVVSAYADNAAAASGNAVDRCSCIVMLNVALGRLLPLQTRQNLARGTSSRRVQMAALTTESVDQAMAQLRERGFATAPIVFDFFDRRNRTAGTLKPERLKTSISDDLIKRSEPDGCWYAYGMSVMDGYHSVLLLVDHRSGTPTIWWMDQFSSGLNVDVTATLDQKITEKTQGWWQAVMDTKNKGYSTTTRVWPLQKPRP
jgi:hypothetical protein